MKTKTSPSTDSALLDRILDPFTRTLTPTAARALVKFRAGPDVQARIAELAEKCNEGQLTPKERAEYEAYVRAGDLVAILQSKARRYLKSLKSR